MLNFLIFLVTNKISGVALGRFLLIFFLIHTVKVCYIINNGLDINGNQHSIKRINVDTHTKMAHLINFCFLVSQIIRALMFR